MNEKKTYIKEISKDPEQSEHASNVTSLRSVERKSYVRSYAMSSGRKRVWLENHMPEQALDVMFPTKKMMSAEEAAADPERREKAKVLMICLGIALVLLLMYPLINFALSRLVIEQVMIEGTDRYSSEEMLEACGFELGDRLPLFSSKAVAKKISTSLPYIKQCEITFVLPGTLIFNVTGEEAVAYTEIFGEYYALSSELKVLERSEDKNKFANMPYLVLPRVDLAVAGKNIVLSEGDAKYVVEFLATLEDSKLASRVGVIYFENKFDIVFSVDGKYRVLLGSIAELPLKLATVNKMIEDNGEECTSYGIIDVRVVEVAGIVINADINPEVRE